VVGPRPQQVCFTTAANDGMADARATSPMLPIAKAKIKTIRIMIYLPEKGRCPIIWSTSATIKSVPQVLVPGSLRHTFASDTWPFITDSRVLIVGFVRRGRISGISRSFGARPRWRGLLADLETGIPTNTSPKMALSALRRSISFGGEGIVWVVRVAAGQEPLPGRSRVEIDLQKHGDDAIARPRELQGLLDGFSAVLRCMAYGGLVTMGFGSLREIARPGLVIKKIDAVLEVGGDDTEVCASTCAKLRAPPCETRSAFGRRSASRSARPRAPSAGFMPRGMIRATLVLISSFSRQYRDARVHIQRQADRLRRRRGNPDE
jgi:hypothetical protein